MSESLAQVSKWVCTPRQLETGGQLDTVNRAWGGELLTTI